MNIAQKIVETVPSLRWHYSAVISKTLYSRGFKTFGLNSVIVSPLSLRGIDHISIGNNVAVYEKSWLQAEANGSLVIGNNVYLGHRVHIHAVDTIEVHDDVMITDGVTISNGSHDLMDHDVLQKTGPIIRSS
ncbi:acyltransferase [Rothia sp. P7208]|uniref:acyltransferase n=1 Tax=Rothia sp. P7208 TaxID=3402660 RepID=UPI003AD3D1B7